MSNSTFDTSNPNISMTTDTTDTTVCGDNSFEGSQSFNKEFSYIIRLMRMDGAEATQYTPTRDSLAMPSIHTPKPSITFLKDNLARNLDHIANDITGLACDLERLAAINRLRFWTHTTQENDYRFFIEVLQLFVVKMDKKVKAYQATYGTATSDQGPFSKRIIRHHPVGVRRFISWDVAGTAEGLAARVESLRDDMLAIQDCVYAVMDAEETCM
ncbi:uncharacterized protein LOC62_03G005147 [Vanrija pseudolonga]|uniref:Uncharacterized protein n=1 Tax=Vanrija pseudolonga TaxID=143232 RepID=A0AAF0YD19_9TREE|nr:hypothetical protein LOC62_03G005147 [Vanrija pseudolonga]